MNSYYLSLNTEVRERYLFKLGSVGLQVDVDYPYIEEIYASKWADDALHDRVRVVTIMFCKLFVVFNHIDVSPKCDAWSPSWWTI